MRLFPEKARGFLFTPVSIKLGVPFVMLRKAHCARIVIWTLAPTFLSCVMLRGWKATKHNLQRPVHKGERGIERESERKKSRHFSVCI